MIELLITDLIDLADQIDPVQIDLDLIDLRDLVDHVEQLQRELNKDQKDSDWG